MSHCLMNILKVSNILHLTVYFRICETISKDQIWRHLNIIEPIFVQALSKNKNDKEMVLKYF